MWKVIPGQLGRSLRGFGVRPKDCRSLVRSLDRCSWSRCPDTSVGFSLRYDSYPQGVQEDGQPLERSYSEMLNLMKLEEQLSPASRGYSCSQEGDEDTTSVASDRSDDTFDMAKGNLSLLEKAIALESERAKVMRDRMVSEHSMSRRDQHHHRIHGEHSPRLSSIAAEERKSRMHPDGLKRAYYPKGR